MTIKHTGLSMFTFYFLHSLPKISLTYCRYDSVILHESSTRSYGINNDQAYRRTEDHKHNINSKTTTTITTTAAPPVSTSTCRLCTHTDTKVYCYSIVTDRGTPSHANTQIQRRVKAWGVWTRTETIQSSFWSLNKSC